MDYYSLDSNIRDSLEFLIPPAKKTLKLSSRDKNYIPDFTRQPDIHIIKTLCAEKYSKPNSTVATDGASSNSAFIKKLPGRKFIKHSIYKDETEIPLIKVTVIPKTSQVKPSRVLNKRKPIVKRVQSTLSNQDSSVTPKNIYLVVTGQNTDKIYEIKTTESEKFSSNPSSSLVKYEHIPLDKLSNYKQIIESLNMDKKRKNDKKKTANASSRKDSRASLVNELFGGAGITLQECFCPNTFRKNSVNYVRPRQSRVRIVGELGLRDDDKYVIHYAATVDDKPVMTNFTHVEQNFRQAESEDMKSYPKDSSACTSGCCTSNYMYNKNTKTRRDSNVQANLLEPTTNREFTKRYSIRSQSQGTQVNLDEPYSKDNYLKKQCRDQIIQCYCNCSNVTSSTVCAATKSSTTKEINSPLVIISVYPKKDAAENISGHTLMNQRELPSKLATETKPQQVLRRIQKRNITTSRTPSPALRNENKSNPFARNVDARFLRYSNKKQNPFHAKFANVPTKSSSPAEVSSGTALKKIDLFKKIPSSFGSRDSKEIHSRSSRRTSLFDGNAKPATKNKRANSPPMSRKTSPIAKSNSSNARDRYNVPSHYRNKSAGPRPTAAPRKMNKAKEAQKYTEDDYGSMENYLMLAEEDRNTEGSLSQTLCHSQSTTGTTIYDRSLLSRTDPVGNSNSDSIDNERRRCIKCTQTSLSCDEFTGSQDSSNFSAPIKHYQGDSCDIMNPLERDKEIRELLGVHHCRRSLSRTITQDYLSGIFSRDTRRKRREQKAPKRSLSSCMTKTEDCKCCHLDRKLTKNRQSRLVNTKTNTTQYDWKDQQTCDLLDQQQLILNRNIQVYLQIEQFTKQKPIMLTRKQYNKLKKTIQSTVKLNQPKEDKCKKNIFKTYSLLSSGQGKKSSIKDTNQGMHHCKDLKGSLKLATQCPQEKVSKHVSLKESRQGHYVCEEVQTISSSRSMGMGRRIICNAYVSYDHDNSSQRKPRQAISSLEIRYANVAYKRVTFSSTNLDPLERSNETDAKRNYLHYLLESQNKRATPNLGSSAYSLYSEESASNQSLKYILAPRDSKQKRPFLRRLMSCLVLHSARASAVKMSCENKASDVNSSIDSYYISTSLEAIEVTSSIYDTSASFNTTHSIFPINKIKRGFLSSVRGFLTNRRS